MRIATWNVNSIRARIDRVIAWLEKSDVDVLAMQEIKCKDAQFPEQRFIEAGYEVAFHGLNQWNGVAICSRVGLEGVQRGFEGQPTWGPESLVEARALAAQCGDVRVWSLYVPNGRTVDDPHYAYKLEWLAALRSKAHSWLTHDPNAQIALAGDWNIAPTDADVWDPAVFVGATHVTPAERAAFFGFADDGWTDSYSARVPAGPNAYTYWDYQQLRFPRNEGMRIDFVYSSPALEQRIASVTRDRDERKGKGASDHVPLIIETA